MNEESSILEGMREGTVSSLWLQAAPPSNLLEGEEKEEEQKRKGIGEMRI